MQWLLHQVPQLHCLIHGSPWLCILTLELIWASPQKEPSSCLLLHKSKVWEPHSSLLSITSSGARLIESHNHLSTICPPLSHRQSFWQWDEVKCSVLCHCTTCWSLFWQILTNEDAIQTEDTKHATSTKGSLVKFQLLVNTGVPCYSPANQLLVPHLVTDRSRPVYGQWGAELEVCIGCLLAMCVLDEYKQNSLWLPATVGRFQLSDRGIDI